LKEEVKKYSGDIILVRGISGSGKTTISNLLSSKNDIVVAADDFMVDSEGNYDFDLYRLNDCHKKCKDTVEDAMKSEKKKIFVHNTFTELWEMKPYFNLAKKYNYRIFSIITENRHEGKSLHDVPEATLEKQKGRFAVSL